MNNNPGGFDPKKQQGKTVTIFSTKKNSYDMPGFERAPSPYQNYMPPSSNFMPRTQDVAGSRGIFQTRKDYFREETFNYSARGNPGFEESRGTPSSNRQVFQDFMNNEFKSQIIQFRFEMTQIMDVSLRDFYEKSSKDQELIQAIKESVNHQTHQAEEFEHKIGEISANLGSVGSFKSFGEESSKMLNAQKMQRIEYQQQEVMRNFDRVKEEVEEQLQASLEDYDQETYKKTSKVVSEIKAHMEEKIEKVFEHLTGKVTVLEKQIQNSSQIDDKIKEDITEKFNSHLQRNQEQIDSTKWAVGNKADEIFLKNSIASFGLDRKIDQAKFELDSITAEIALVAEKIKQENMALNNRAIDLENKYYDQSLQYKTASSSFDLSLSPSKRSTSVDYEKKVSEIEKEFEEIKIDQRDLGNNIVLQKIQLEKSRPSSPKMFDATTAQSEEAQLRRLEEMIDGLSESIEILKEQTILQETTKTRDKNQNPLYSSQKIESSPLFSSRELEKSSPGSRMRRLSIHSSNSSPGHARGEEPMTKSSINLDQNKHHQKAHSTHSSPGVTRNSKGSESTTIVIHSATDQKLENNNNAKVENEKPAAEAEEDDDDEIEVVLQIDDDGYLLDENGNYYFDKNGDKIKLDEKQIERLRIHNLIEEDD